MNSEQQSLKMEQVAPKWWLLSPSIPQPGSQTWQAQRQTVSQSTHRSKMQTWLAYSSCHVTKVQWYGSAYLKTEGQNGGTKKGFVAPVAPLLADLWGHLLAGLPWEKYLEEEFTQSGREKLHPWKCVYYHRKEQLFLNVYVDNLKWLAKLSISNPCGKVQEKS